MAVEARGLGLLASLLAIDTSPELAQACFDAKLPRFLTGRLTGLLTRHLAARKDEAVGKAGRGKEGGGEGGGAAGREAGGETETETETDAGGTPERLDGWKGGEDEDASRQAWPTPAPCAGQSLINALNALRRLAQVSCQLRINI